MRQGHGNAGFVSASDSIVGIISSSAHSGGTDNSLVGVARNSKHSSVAVADASVSCISGSTLQGGACQQSDVLGLARP